MQTVAIMGLGYVGLPLVREFSRAGFQVIGFDIDKKKIDLLKKKKSYLLHIPSSLIGELVEKKQFCPTNDPRDLERAQSILICVPTPLTPFRTPELGYVRSTAQTITAHLQKGQLVVLESTTYPGTTREILLPLLETTGLKEGQDFFLAYSPEREDPGNQTYQTGKIPKIVGANSQASLQRALKLYENISPQVVPMDSTEEAEAVKILENVYRAVNIALVNELKMVFDRMGINIWKVVEGAATKPFGFQKFLPGPGLGGHCIPIDPFYLTWKAKEYDISTRFIELAGQINTAMPYHVIHKLESALSDRGKALNGAKILILGIAYKKDVDDMRESPAFKLMDLLQKRKALVTYHDPHIDQFSGLRNYPDLKLQSISLTAETLAEQDAILLVTDHSAVDYSFVVAHSSLVVDTRNATKDVKDGREKIVLA